MSTAAEILSHAMALPPQERATIAQSLLHSLPPGPQLFRTELQLSAELKKRLEAAESGKTLTMDANETLQRAREAVQRVRNSRSF